MIRWCLGIFSLKSRIQFSGAMFSKCSYKGGELRGDWGLGRCGAVNCKVEGWGGAETPPGIPVAKRVITEEGVPLSQNSFQQWQCLQAVAAKRGEVEEEEKRVRKNLLVRMSRVRRWERHEEVWRASLSAVSGESHQSDKFWDDNDGDNLNKMKLDGDQCKEVECFR